MPSLMDGVYRYQRHIYDLTRKYYLLGRDRMISGLDVPAGGTVLELGCGTGRNIVLAARRYPDARFFGLDISAEMLETAAAATGPRRHRRPRQTGAGRRDRFRRAGPVRPRALRPRLHLLCAVDDPRLGEDASRGARSAGSGRLAAYRRFRPAGAPAALVPHAAARLAEQNSTSRRVQSLREVLELEAERNGASLRFRTLYRGYAWLAVVGQRSRQGVLKFRSGRAGVEDGQLRASGADFAVQPRHALHEN